jgi:hypothetical protein
MNKLKTLLAVVPFLLAACTDPNKAPAQSAIQAGDGAVATLTADVEKLAPELGKATRDALATAKAAAAKEDWKAALAIAKTVPESAEKAVAAAKAKKEEIEKAAAAKLAAAKAAYEQAQSELPKKIDALKKKIAAFAKAKKLPAGITKADVAKGKDRVTALEAGYKTVSEQGKLDVVAASASAQQLMAQADDATAALTPKAPAKAPAPAKKKGKK